MARTRWFGMLIYYGFAWILPGSPVPGHRYSHAIRRWVCGSFVESIGHHVQVNAHVYFGRGNGIRIGDRSLIGKGTVLNPGVQFGADVLVGPECIFLTMNHEFSDPSVVIRLQGQRALLPVVVEDDVWLGSRVIVLPGVTVGRGAVIGAGSVVTRDVPPYSVNAGNPARVIGQRGPADATAVSKDSDDLTVDGGGSPVVPRVQGDAR